VPLARSYCLVQRLLSLHPPRPRFRWVGVGGPAVYGPGPVLRSLQPLLQPLLLRLRRRLVGDPVIGFGFNGGSMAAASMAWWIPRPVADLGGGHR